MDGEASRLRERAKSYRRMLASVDDPKAREALNALAKQCEVKADAVDSELLAAKADTSRVEGGPR